MRHALCHLLVADSVRRDPPAGHLLMVSQKLDPLTLFPPPHANPGVEQDFRGRSTPLNWVLNGPIQSPYLLEWKTPRIRVLWRVSGGTT
jgi:hypothetical protein